MATRCFLKGSEMEEPDGIIIKNTQLLSYPTSLVVGPSM